MFETSKRRTPSDIVAVLDAAFEDDAMTPEFPGEEFFQRGAGRDVDRVVLRLRATGPGGWVQRVGVDGIDLAAIQQCADEIGTADSAEVLACLNDLDPQTMTSDREVVELLAALQRVSTWIEARQEQVLLAFARRPMRPLVDQDGRPPSLVGEPGDVTREFVAEELAPRLGSSPRTVAQRLSFASELVTRFPASHVQRSRGRLDRSKAHILQRECASLDVDACERVELHVLDRAAQQSPAQFGRTVRRHVAAIDPTASAERCASERAERRVSVEPSADGMAWLNAYVPAESALAIHAALTAAAKNARDVDPADERTLDQLRADLLAWPFEQALLTGVLAGPVDQTLSGSRGARPQIHVTATLPMLLGLSQEPAELAGYGPIPASVARRIAADGTWRRLITDTMSGAVLDLGTTTYRPPADLLRYVQARDLRCRFPGCSRPAIACDVDHVVPFPHGPTAAHNLAVLCRRHHRFKHHDPDEESLRSGPEPAVYVTPSEGGGLHWRLPSGHEYAVEPEPPL